MKSIKIYLLEFANQLLLSLLGLILIIVIAFVPENKVNFASKVNSAKIGFTLLSDDDKGIAEFGKVNFQYNESKNGYAYISNKKRNKSSFAIINLNSASDDKVFQKRVAHYFNSESIQCFKSKNYNYAVFDNNSVYIENIGNNSVIGFNDVIDLGVIVNSSGALDSIIYISSNETASYINKIIEAEYFQRYDNLNLSKNNVIDAVAGATITTVAVAKSVDELINATKKDILSDYVDGISNFSVSAELDYMWIVNLGLLIILFSVFAFKLVKTKRIKNMLFVFSVLWLGFYLNSSFTYLLFIKAFSGIELSIFTSAYLLLILFSSIWDKNTYCRSICPYGNAQRLIKKVSPFKQKKFPFKNKRLKQFRYAISILIVISYFAGIDKITSYELFPHLFGMEISSFMLYVSVFAIFISLWIPNLYCRAFCTTGCTLDIIADLSNKKKINLIKLKS